MSPAPIDAILRALSGRQPIDEPAAIVVAHPDDETIGAGPFLHLFRRLLLIHVTDGAPRNLLDARGAGFDTCDAYAAARTRELHDALRAGGILPAMLDTSHPCGSGGTADTGPPAATSPAAKDAGYPATTVRMLALNVPDQGAALVLPWLAAKLTALLADRSVVLTHAYEAGHPDHDAVAFAVQATGRPRIEMALYHAAPDGSLRTGTFLPGPPETTLPETVLPLSAGEQAVRSAMLDSFTTQRATLTAFRGAGAYRFRPAPTYDFTCPAAERAYYDGFDWGMTSARWRSLATEATLAGHAT